jgi:hypothetical protein
MSVLPLFGLDSNALVRRWRDHPQMRATVGVEARRKLARRLSYEGAASRIQRDIDTEAQREEAELRKTFFGRVKLRLANLVVYPVVFIEWLFDP